MKRNTHSRPLQCSAARLQNRPHVYFFFLFSFQNEMAGVRDGLVDTLVLLDIPKSPRRFGSQISELGSCLFPFFGAGLWDGPFWNRRSMIMIQLCHVKLNLASMISSQPRFLFEGFEGIV